MSCFRFRDGLIAHYGEAFDRGVALVQLDFSAERSKHILARAATKQTATRKPNVTFIAFPLGERQRGENSELFRQSLLSFRPKMGLAPAVFVLARSGLPAIVASGTLRRQRKRGRTAQSGLSSRGGPRVRRLAAGGGWIRTLGPPEREPRNLNRAKGPRNESRCRCC